MLLDEMMEIFLVNMTFFFPNHTHPLPQKTIFILAHLDATGLAPINQEIEKKKHSTSVGNLVQAKQSLAQLMYRLFFTSQFSALYVSFMSKILDNITSTMLSYA